MARDISIRLSVEDADRVKAVLHSVGATGEQAFAAFERGATAGAQSFTKLERSLDPLVASQARFAAAQAGINRALESGLTTQERATQLLDLAKRRYVDLDDAAGKVSTGTAKLGTVIGQAGFQIQDFAVQVAGGQNAMTALAQQGSQLLGVFGNFGAVAGAALAIGAIAAQMIYGKSAAEQFTATLEAQNSAYDDALRQADRMQDALKRQQDQYRSATEAGQRYRDGLRGEGEALVRLTDYYARLTEAERQAETARIRATADQRRAAAQYALDQASNRISGRVAVVEGNVAAPETDPLSLIGPNGPAALPTQLQSAVAAFQQFRDAGNLTTEALSRYIAEVRRAIEAGGDHSRELAELERSLIEVLPIINQLEEANRRLAVQQRALSNADPQTVALERGRSAAEQLGGAYQQRQQLQRQMRDLRAALPLASSREEASAFRSSMQAGAAALEGLTPATTQMLRGLRDQATLAHVAAGAARELAASDIALDNAARQAGAGQASLAEKTEGRRLVQLRLDGQLMDALETLNRQINGTDRLAEAQLRGGAAAREAEARTRAETEALKYRAETDERYANVVQVLTTRYVALGEAQARARSAQTEYNQQQQLELLRAEQSLVAGNVALRERELAVLRERQRLDQEGVVDEAARARRLANAARIADETQALRRQQEAWNDLANLGSQAFDRIGNAITQAFANGEMRTIRFGNIAKAVAAEVAQYFAKIALVNPILNAVFGTSRPTISDLGGIVGSLFGGSRSSGAGSIMIDGVPLAAYQPLGDGVSGPVLSLPAGVAYSVLGGSGIGGFGSGAAAGGGMGLMQLLGLAGSGGSLMNNMGGGSMLGGIGRWLGLTGEGGLFNSIGNGISNFLATPLWTYGNLPNATNAALANMGGVYGPATPAQVAAEGAGVATLGQVAGGVLGLAGGAYGIYSGIQKGGIGGAFQVAGGAVGMAAGASSLLAAAGVIGASMGPVGWIAAAVLAVVGALLPGQKRSNREGNATFDFVEDSLSISGQTGKKYSQANRDSASNLLKGVVDITERFEKTLGLRFDQKVTVGVGDRDGIYYSVNDAGAVTMGRYGRSDQGAKDLARDLLGTLVRQSAADLPDAALRNPLTNMKWTSLEEGLQLIQQLVEVTNNARPSASQNIAAANIDWSDFANGLADLKWVKETYDVMVQGNSPAEKFARELQQLNDSFDAAVEKARDLGLSEEALNQARAKQVQAAYDKRELEGLQLVARQQNTLTSFLDNLTYQNATPAEKLRLAQQGFGNVLAAARSADLRTADLASVTQAAGTLIEAGRNYYATGPGAAELERFVRSSIESLGAQLQLPAFGGDLALSLEAAVNPLKDELELLRDEVTALREELRTSRLRAAA